jgi:hypothetical protein
MRGWAFFILERIILFPYSTPSIDGEKNQAGQFKNQPADRIGKPTPHH